jgi:hypothetical protein
MNLLVPVSRIWWDDFPQWSGWKWDGWIALGAVGTLLAAFAAVGIALWGPWLASRFFKPRLKVDIKMARPDCIRIQTRTGPESWVNSYYFRLRITNEGNREAVNVEARLRKLWIVYADGALREDRDFVPLNLTWANTDQLSAADQIRQRIQPRLDKHCNLLRTLHEDEAHPVFEFCTEVTPNQIVPGEWYTKKRPNNYQVDIAVSANNAKVVYKRLLIRFSNWIEDEDQMYREGLVVKIVG